MADIYQMEPMLPGEGRWRELEDLAMTLNAEATGLASMLHPDVHAALADLVRSMNCYYSNFLEGHNTHPRDIDRALNKDFVDEPEKRDLQREAYAHITVQRMIDRGEDGDLQVVLTKDQFSVARRRLPPLSADYAVQLHRWFCRLLPPELLLVKNLDGLPPIPVEPGKYRRHEVEVGRHLPPVPEDIERFMARFDEAYDFARLSKVKQVVAVAAAHHRFLWIHPFIDGNGRVARLTSHAAFARLGLSTGLWSVARGLARQATAYKALLAGADLPRRADLDGRGNLSEEGLVRFCVFFLKTAIDQVAFMRGRIAPDELLRRIEAYVKDEALAGRLPAKSFLPLREAFYGGAIERGRIADIVGASERTGRSIASILQQKRLLVPTSPNRRAPLRLSFPLDVVERWLPGLYPVDSAPETGFLR